MAQRGTPEYRQALDELLRIIAKELARQHRKFMTDPEHAWHYDPEFRIWSYRVRHAYVTLEKRPAYCDRGHWVGKVFGVFDIDGADAFPRYYMDEQRAKDELREWLHWRQKVPAS